jgi:hypothetical protein
MMQNDVLKGITRELDGEFGYPVYTDNIEQGLETPCFLVTDLTSTDEHIVMNRHNRSYPFMIQYFPQSQNYRMECADVSDRLFECLECITVAGYPARGTDMGGNVTDGVLNFEATYELQVFRTRRTDEETMENIDVNQKVKE